MMDVPCECGYVHRVEIHPPRFYNMRQTSMIVSEHAGPIMCPGCIRLVTPCLVSVRDVVHVCLPVTRKPTLAGAPTQTATTSVTPEDQQLDPDQAGDAGESREVVEEPLDPRKVM